MSCSSHQTGGQTAFKEDRALLTEGPPGAVLSEEYGCGFMDYVVGKEWQNRKWENVKLGLWRGGERNW